LTVAQLFALKTLADAPALSVSELARRTCTHQSTLASVLAFLVSSQLVTRGVSNTDGAGARTELTVTTRGRALLADVTATAQERLIECIEQLPSTERHVFASSLRSIVAGMLLDEERPVMFFEEEASDGEQKRTGPAFS